MPAPDSLEAAFRDEIAFSTNFPLPYRVLALGAVGILGWATNLHGLNLLGIDAATALELSTRQSKPRPSDPSPTSSVSSLPLPTRNPLWFCCFIGATALQYAGATLWRRCMRRQGR